MVYIDDQKFACQSCIKGHRSSSCTHTDRPLFEIRKKGRPVTQCDHCRDLRRTKQLHVKCICPERKDPEADIGPVEIQSSSSSTSCRKAGRKIPLVPKYPNGIKDVDDRASPLSPREATPAPSSILSADFAVPTTPSSSTEVGSVSSPVSSTPVGEPKSCCCRKPATHSRSPSLQSISIAPPVIATPLRRLEPVGGLNALGQSSLLRQTPIAPTLSSTVPTISTVTKTAHVQKQETMSCLCGSGCMCLGCTKHRPYGDEGITNDTEMHEAGCPPDCPSCCNMEDGFAWPSTSSRGGSSFSQSAGQTQKSLSHSTKIPDISFDDSMEEDWDDELDAEGSPDPDYVTLPDVSTEIASRHNAITLTSEKEHQGSTTTNSRRRTISQKASAAGTSRPHHASQTHASINHSWRL